MKRIQVLGAGCPKCRKLAENAQAAAAALGAEYRVEKITDIAEIMRLGALMVPALAVDGVVKVAGRVPDAEEIRKLLT
jgi:small redox-active disulfide protein 2